jgi:hypothetical protein
VREIGLPLLWLALLLLPFDVGVRRLVGRWEMGDRSQEAAPKRSAFGLLKMMLEKRAVSVEIQPPTPNPQLPTPNLDRLREAQEQARRRARGEE